MILTSASMSRTRSLFAAALIAVVGVSLSHGAWAQGAAASEGHTPPVTKGSPISGGIATEADMKLPAALEPGAGVQGGDVKKDPSTMNLGLKMHGHWVIDVKNPDGTVVEHRDFQNSLSGGAQGILIGLLAGYYTPGDYMIVLGGSGGAGPCTATFQFCGIVRSLTTQPALGYCGAYYCGTGLTYSYNFGTNFGGPYSMVLAGSITSNQTGQIGTVYSLYGVCSSVVSPTNPSTLVTTSPAACQATPSNSWYGPLSSTTLGSPIAVVNGQIIQVSVTITFS